MLAALFVGMILVSLGVGATWVKTVTSDIQEKYFLELTLSLSNLLFPMERLQQLQTKKPDCIVLHTYGVKRDGTITNQGKDLASMAAKLAMTGDGCPIIIPNCRGQSGYVRQIRSGLSEHGLSKLKLIYSTESIDGIPDERTKADQLMQQNGLSQAIVITNSSQLLRVDFEWKQHRRLHTIVGSPANLLDYVKEFIAMTIDRVKNIARR